MGSSETDLAAENRVLRARVAQLENALAADGDPLLKVLVENAPAYLTVVTTDGRFMATGRTNESFGSVIGRSVYEFTDPESHAIIRETLQRAAASGEPSMYECKGLAESGEADHTYIVRVIPISKDGVVASLALIPMDITERVRLEQSLMENERALRVAIAASQVGLWRWDVGHDRFSWDARTCEIFRVDQAPGTFDAYMQLIHRDDQGHVRETIRRAIEAGTYPTFEHRLATQLGEPERWVLAAGTVARDQAGKVTELIGGVLDVSEQKRLAVQVECIERLEALGQLSAGIAHNFNNLLTAIVPNVETVLASARDVDRAPLSAALDAALQARDLVASLLALTGRRVIQRAPRCDPKDVVQRVVSMCRMTFPHGIEISSQLAEDLGYARMPPTDLEQVLLHLMFNARDAVASTSGRARRIELIADVLQDADAKQVRLRVTDTGPGMTDLVRRRIFEPFFTTKQAQRGTGLGLSSAFALVRDSKGTLECDSSSADGSSFSVVLPTAAPPAAAVSARPSAHEARGETILVVDDEAMIRAVVGRLLRSQHYKVLEASSAAEARKVLDSAGPKVDLIILDHSMPKESGVECLPSLRARCAAPVVLFTGLAPEAPLGVACVLPKPARPSELFQVVRTTLDAARASVAVANSSVSA